MDKIFRKNGPDMSFNAVFNFLVKRFNEIGFKETDEFIKFANRMRVYHPVTNNLDSGLIINPDYKAFGLTLVSKEK